MSRILTFLAGACVATLGVCPAGAQDPVPAAAAQPAPIVRAVTIRGTHELSDEAVRKAARLEVGAPLPPLDDVKTRIELFYRDQDYTFATAKPSFDDATGELLVAVDEGRIDGVEFTGVEARLARSFSDDFALRAGDIFNRKKARQALDVLLRPTRGAVRAGHIYERGASFTDTGQLPLRRGTFDIVDRNGERILLVGLAEPAGRFRVVPDLGDREDWFSSVDGFTPSLGFGAAVFDHDQFNHAYVAGHLSYKAASDRAGYALGFERPLFATRKLYVGGELHDLTASDDQWQVSSLEASLAAVGPRRSYRDYYRRRGIQIGGAYRVHPQIEALFAWRAERQEPLAIASDFSFWNSDESFRPNRTAQNGRLNAFIIGASIDGDGFEQESLDATYRRHLLDTPFGARLDRSDARGNRPSIWRIDWTSEISTRDLLDSDFDFRRHIVSGRYRVALSPHQEFGARAIGGWSGGTLPPQRTFAIGGIGSVHGYEFKEAIGDSLALLNLEYSLGWQHGLRGIGFFDVGRVGRRDTLSLPVNPNAHDVLKGVGFGVGLGDFRIDFGYKAAEVPSSLQVLLRFGRTF